MKKARKILITLVIIGVLVAAAFFGIGYLRPKSAGINIETSPQASVLINGEQVGRTPYEATRDPGEVIIKLIPDSFEKPLVPFETKLELTGGIQTVIRREFADPEETSSGIIISFERIGGKETSIAVVSVPDAAQISIDGTVRGFAPYKTSSITPGEHQLVISAPKHIDRTVLLKTVEGYKLTAVVKLAPAEDTKEEVDLEQLVSKVEILPTSTGFLRVRAEPTTSGEELARVDPGERYNYVETDEDTGWFKIEYEEGEEGWISNEYGKLVEETKTPEPSPSPSV